MNLQWYMSNGVDIDNSVGIDEVGRGPLAGPVVSAAVWICSDLANFLEKNSLTLPVRDSKKMSILQRSKVLNWINKQSYNDIRYSIGFASVEEIDELNILQASLLSMKRAYDSLGIQKNTVLIDGNIAPDFDNMNSDCDDNKKFDVKTVVSGDAKVMSISLASIIAKEYRDNLMKKLAKDFPEYKWNTNVGYGSKAHLNAISKFGISCHHRKSFAPIAACIACKQSAFSDESRKSQLC